MTCGALRAVHEHRADHEVDVGQALLDLQRRGVARGGAASSNAMLELAQAVDVAVVDVDLGLHAERDDAPRSCPTTPPPITITLAGRDARHAAEQEPAAAERLLEHERARLRGDLARDLAHRRQQRQPAARVLDGLVGDARRAGLDEARASARRPARGAGR